MDIIHDYRAYVGKDGKPAAFSADNVPFKPKRWLRLAHESLDSGDFVIVAGYPGSTNRYALADDFDNTASWSYPVIGGHLKKVVALVEAAGAADADIAVKYAATVRGWQNTMKNYDGQLEGFRRIGAAERKRAEENAVLAWLRARGKDGKPALAAHARLVALSNEARSSRERDLAIGQLSSIGLLGSVRGLYRLAIERAKPDAERASGYQDRDLANIEGSARQLEKRYHPTMEKQLLAYWLGEYLKLPASKRIAAVDQWAGRQ